MRGSINRETNFYPESFTIFGASCLTQSSSAFQGLLFGRQYLTAITDVTFEGKFKGKNLWAEGVLEREIPEKMPIYGE
ncbi:hypothetical protein CEXT_150711 [Caerostris extrusa]|uniref:Uncharacterized protein n=1 Tax=Caerostris extrusa TaxID=172846 RepID=A0AAV4MQY5_CAEEX|nr:hypothetical protein CEXT_150711 [Caerostris extrusa]